MKKLFFILLVSIACENTSTNQSNNETFNLEGYTFTLDSVESFLSSTQCSGEINENLDQITQYLTDSDYLKSFKFTSDSVRFVDNSNYGLNFSSCPSWNDEYDQLWEIKGNLLSFQSGGICWEYDEFIVTSDSSFYMNVDPICCKMLGEEPSDGISCSSFYVNDKEQCENQGEDYYWINCYRKNYRGMID